MTKRPVIKDLSVPSSKGQIKGRLYLHDKKQKNPLIILAHGLGDSMESVEGYAQTFFENGYDTYLFNFIGGSMLNDMTKMSIFTEKDDLNVVVDYFSNKKRKLILFGASQGGVVASLVASLRNDITALILLYPAFVMKDEMQRLFANQKLPKTFDFAGMCLGKVYVEKLSKYDLWGNSTKFKGPTLIVHGTADQTVPIRYSIEAVRKFTKARLVEVTHAGHDFYGRDQMKVSEEILRFLESVKGISER
ncbi:hypothetical protein A7K95_00170 [Pediococcus parvulus]|uniref:Prolyl oligopeptidase family serine peptidase n=1 Tax=Pediococcus parvulus TaxID=54062 RepID=A0AAP5TE07_9LACO|nr:alpha/beta fold hydrolase [Pediococcus parvulus]MDV7694826.1 prolyl oligopeptidase family serine peptidase [Pediococcus parvulus]OAD65016.1 hypothetical protein A7K95_00170 [Pediococcus parvulus]